MFRRLFDQYGNEIGEISSHYGPVFDASGVQIGNFAYGSYEGSAAIGVAIVYVIIGLAILGVIAAVCLVRLSYLGVMSLLNMKYRAATAYLALPVVTLIVILGCIAWPYVQQFENDKANEAQTIQDRVEAIKAVVDLNLHPDQIDVTQSESANGYAVFKVVNHSQYTIRFEESLCTGYYHPYVILKGGMAEVACQKQYARSFCPLFYSQPNQYDETTKVKLDKNICK